MLDQFRNRLNLRGSKYVSPGGRIVLLNSVLNAIPIFFLSFLKIPAKVVRMMNYIQRDFFWELLEVVKRFVELIGGRFVNQEAR